MLYSGLPGLVVLATLPPLALIARLLPLLLLHHYHPVIVMTKVFLMIRPAEIQIVAKTVTTKSLAIPTTLVLRVVMNWWTPHSLALIVAFKSPRVVPQEMWPYQSQLVTQLVMIASPNPLRPRRPRRRTQVDKRSEDYRI